MSITLHLSESTERKLAQLASAKGFADVASYIQQLVELQAQQISDVELLQEEFRGLADQWYEESRFLSIAKRMTALPSFRKIVDMGERAIPLILAEMQQREGHWYLALRELTGINPVPEQSRGKLEEMNEAWLQWGREQGYLR